MSINTKKMTKEEKLALYKSWWPVLDEMPEGYRLDEVSDSPLHGYKFAFDKSILKGSKRCLVRSFCLLGEAG